MGLISKIKSVLGVAGDGKERTQERPSAATADGEPEASSERAVKGVDQPAGDEAGAEPEASTGRAETTATGSAGDEAGGTTRRDAGGESIESIKGIGSAYAQRLADAGVDSVAELARADPEELAAATDLGTGRVRKWIERARARTE